MGTPCRVTDGTGSRVLSARIWARFVRPPRGTGEVAQKTPLFLGPPKIPVPDPITNHLPHPNQQKQTMSQYFSNNTNALNTINVSNNFTVADNRYNILAWLSSLDPKLRHQDIQDRRVENVGEWFFKTHQFISWYEGSGGSESDNAILFCYGDPGVGKTFIR